MSTCKNLKSTEKKQTTLAAQQFKVILMSWYKMCFTGDGQFGSTKMYTGLSAFQILAHVLELKFLRNSLELILWTISLNERHKQVR